MFPDLVSRYFQFLIDDYALTLIRSSSDGMGDTFEYKNDRCSVLVAVDRGQVSTEIFSAERDIIRRIPIHVFEVVRLKDPSYEIVAPYDMHRFPLDRAGSVERQLAE